MQPPRPWGKRNTVRYSAYMATTDQPDMAELRRMFPDRTEGQIKTMGLDILAILDKGTTRWTYPS